MGREEVFARSSGRREKSINRKEADGGNIKKPQVSKKPKFARRPKQDRVRILAKKAKGCQGYSREC